MVRDLRRRAVLALLFGALLPILVAAEAVGAEELVETGVEGLLLLLGLGERQRQGVLEHRPIPPADPLGRLQRVQRPGDGDAAVAAAQRREEVAAGPSPAAPWPQAPAAGPLVP